MQTRVCMYRGSPLKVDCGSESARTMHNRLIIVEIAADSCARRVFSWTRNSSTARGSRSPRTRPASFPPHPAWAAGSCASSLRGPIYPSAIARELKVYHQTVYYHVRKLERAGLVKKVGQRVVRGGTADLYALAVDGFAVEFPVKPKVHRDCPPPPGLLRSAGSSTSSSSSGSLDGWIVVGSPEPHGPNRTQGRDGHYAIQVGFALGQFVRLPQSFPVKLDVDLKNEKLEKSNLIVVGGPRTNVVAAEINSHLPIRFYEEGFWGSIVDEEGTKYSSDWDALIAKVRNPWNAGRILHRGRRPQRLRGPRRRSSA